MNELKHIRTISDLTLELGVKCVRNPLVEVFDMKRAEKFLDFDNMRLTLDFFMIVYKKSFCGNVLYGQNRYDYFEGTLLFYAPHQTVCVRGLAQNEPQGYLLMFHPEFLRGAELDRIIRSYTFFEYGVNEALHVSEEEWEKLRRCMDKVNEELERPLKSQQRAYLLSSLSMLLNHCSRFYERQFSTRHVICQDVVSRFEREVLACLSDKGTRVHRLPSMTYLAERLYLSPNYLGDLIKNATGQSAKEFIDKLVIDEAKRRLLSSELPINEIAYSLGFEYPQYFSQKFKKSVGIPPKAYRDGFLNS